MNDLQIFVYNGEQLRTIQRADGLWWVLRDVCHVLELTTPARVAERLDDDEKAEVSLTHISSNGVEQKRTTTIINEPGLYAVILRSDKPNAKQFKRWVTHDVLPSIRKTGSYGVSSTLVEQLTAAQKNLLDWRALTAEWKEITASACRRYDDARKHYDSCRGYRERCRKNLQQAQENVDALVSAIAAAE